MMMRMKAATIIKILRYLENHNTKLALRVRLAHTYFKAQVLLLTPDT
jgi:hypothetical protein